MLSNFSLFFRWSLGVLRIHPFLENLKNIFCRENLRTYNTVRGHFTYKVSGIKERSSFYNLPSGPRKDLQTSRTAGSLKMDWWVRWVMESVHQFFISWWVYISSIYLLIYSKDVINIVISLQMWCQVGEYLGITKFEIHTISYVTYYKENGIKELQSLYSFPYGVQIRFSWRAMYRRVCGWVDEWIDGWIDGWREYWEGV